MSKTFKNSQLIELIKALFKEITREPGVLFWGIVFPILMALGLGIAFTQKTDTVKYVAVIKSENITNSNSISSKLNQFFSENAEKVKVEAGQSSEYKLSVKNNKLGNTNYFFIETDWKNATVLLKRGKVNVIISNEKGKIDYHFDPLNPDAQLTYINLSSIIGKKKLTLNRKNENVEPLTVSGTRYIDFLIPGLIAMGIMMSTMWGISYNIIDKRSKKLLRRMIATPMKKSNFLIAMITVRTTMNFIEALLLFLFAYFAFDITIQGSLGALILIFIAGNIAFAGVAIITSSHTANTEIGNGVINAVVLPMVVLSGIFFSYHNFPSWSVPYIQKLPLTLLADGMRSIFIEGASYSQVVLPSVILLAVGATFFSIGVKIFKWY